MNWKQILKISIITAIILVTLYIFGKTRSIIASIYRSMLIFIKTLLTFLATPTSSTTTTTIQNILEAFNSSYDKAYEAWAHGSEPIPIYNSSYDNKVDRSGDTMTGSLIAPAINTTNLTVINTISQIESENCSDTTAPSDTITLCVEDFKGYSIFKFIDDSGQIFEPEEGVLVGKNTLGTAIPRNSIVYNCGSSGNVPLLCLARADNISTSKVIGITIEEIADGSFGRYRFMGKHRMDTSSWSENDLVFLSEDTAGEMTVTPPLTPNLTVEIGRMRISGAGDGELQVMVGDILGDEFGTINNFTISQNLIVQGCIQYNCSQPTGCVTLGTCI